MKHQCANGVARPTAYAIDQQRACAKRWRKDKHPGAWDGLCDWLMEECLLELEARNARMDD